MLLDFRAYFILENLLKDVSMSLACVNMEKGSSHLCLPKWGLVGGRSGGSSIPIHMYDPQ